MTKLRSFGEMLACAVATREGDAPEAARRPDFEERLRQARRGLSCCRLRVHETGSSSQAVRFS